MDFQILPRDQDKIKKYIQLYRKILRYFFDPTDIVIFDCILNIFFKQFYFENN